MQLGVQLAVSWSIPKVASRMKAGLSGCRALVVTIPSETGSEKTLFLVGSALPELSATPSKSKDIADRQASGFRMKLRIFMTFASNKIQL